jgi:hypothetical protein
VSCLVGVLPPDAPSEVGECLADVGAVVTLSGSADEDMIMSFLGKSTARQELGWLRKQTVSLYYFLFQSLRLYGTSPTGANKKKKVRGTIDWI